MGFLEEREVSVTIPEFYKGKVILITGGTGFMGKVLVEKLLYSCSELERVYLLMRSKKQVAARARLDDYFAKECFVRLRTEKPELLSKVTVVCGDMMELGLGLSDEDRQMLVDSVNVIFHVAASVRFDDPLSFATKLNLRGTREVVALAEDVKKLDALVHVSTSYSNTNRNPVEEVVYPAHAAWRDTIAVAETVDEHTLRTLTPKYLGELPNTYTFTKQLAEHVVYEQRGRLPAVIVRPSIVISSAKEPFPGWIENFNGPVGILIACGKGIMRSIYTDPELVADYMPVDVAIKNIIAAGWVRGAQPLQPTDDIPIYNCCAAELNHITMRQLVDVGKELCKEVPLNDALWPVGGNLTTSRTMHYIKVMFLHLLPAIFVDMILWLLGRKPMLVKVQRKIYIANIALEYYITQQWTFTNKNFVALRSHIKEEDKEQFYYEVEGIDVFNYYRSAVIGGRRYLLNEKDEDLEKARRHYMRITWLDRLTTCLVIGVLVYWVLRLQCVRTLLKSFEESL